ncbi:tyrosine-type recombinase/integrase [Glycomyces sp. MUSA5-2]|uniref:tyrosine-type recombinase/integrase n=1 Tax=Glycomyces sp. MUSA5-2 TaxID=2053002 RepID=UPI00300A4422
MSTTSTQQSATTASSSLSANDAAASATPAWRPGPFDSAEVETILNAIEKLPTWTQRLDRSKRGRRDAAAILTWLELAPGATWQDRWEFYETKYEGKWIGGIVDDLIAATGRGRSDLPVVLGCLIQVRLFRPSYDFLCSFKPVSIYRKIRALVSPELFLKTEHAGKEMGMAPRPLGQALNILTSLVITTGKPLEEIGASDLLAFRDAHAPTDRRVPSGTYGAWLLLVDLGQIESGTTLESVSRPGQRPVDELVDWYRIKSPSVREVLIRYLRERRAGMDYSTFRERVTVLVGTFWADIEKHHPGIDSLHLPEDVAIAWKERLRYVDRGGERVPRKSYFDVLMKVRSFYLDIAEWALEDPSWARWAVPCPIRRGETEGLSKSRKVLKAAMHQRIRERLPHLPRMVDAAETWKDDAARLLEATERTAIDVTFEHDGRRYQRTVPAKSRRPGDSNRGTPRVLAIDLATGETIDVGNQEDRAFWAWACVETFRHTGTRIEELLELTHLALVSYRLPDTGEVVPLLQIVPSKNGEERLLLVTPELASVLASIVQRVRTPEGTIPLVARYDGHERTTGPELPHLFQRQFGWRRQVISPGTVPNLLNEVLARTGLTDRAGRPLHCTPHDFRRMFSTEAVTGGLPIHIAAKILGHANINTTEGYTAVFQDDLIHSYRAFVDRRRSTRPSEEYREPTAEEWIEFQQHFALRKLELGDCGRPYGTPCAHEHACVRCPMLRVDPRAKGRLQEIIANLTERIEEARANGWLGEIEGLKTSQTAAISKLASLNRAERNKPGRTELGLPSTRRNS